MRTKLKIPHYAALVLAVCLLACNNTRHLPAGERLFRGSRVTIHDKEAKKSDRKQLTNDLAGLVRPRPNTKFLGARMKLGLYNLAGGETQKKKGLKHWLRYKVGEPPVLTSAVHLDANNKLMVNFLENKGFFEAEVKSRFDSNVHKKSRALFDIKTGPQYTINTVELRKDTSELYRKIDSDFSNTMLLQGAPYNLDVIKAERLRIDRMLKEKGYYYFKPDYLLILADSTIGNHKVNLYVKIKNDETPDEAYRMYTLNDIYVYANYKLNGRNQDTDKTHAVKEENYYVVDSKHAFKPSVFSDALICETGDKYSLDDQNTSISRLVNAGVFKFVKNRLEPWGDTQLNEYFYLTPFPKKSLRFQIGALTDNDNRTGTRGSMSWRNRNAFKGAEELVFKINGGIETQYSTLAQPPIYTFGAETDLSFPRFVIPFAEIHNTSRFLPRTLIRLKADYETELTLLSITSFSASYGFDWKESIQKEHQLYPINFTYVLTDTLSKTNQLHLLYGSLVFNGIILGPTYEYTFNSQVGGNPKNGFYFDGLVDLSGNVFGVAGHANRQPQAAGSLVVAQYLKLQPDLRYYWHLSKTSELVARAMVGIGIPYGNSYQLPNIKQFWAGGNSDLRGFPSRLVGPGTFNEYSVYHTNQYIETLGDMKMEMNLELRKKLYKFINGAIFADAGNIWLYNDNPAFPGGKFTGNFYQQLATDVGFGLRFDFSILLFRLDFGIPVSKPWTTVSDVSNNNSSIANSFVLNIAIGYPF